MGYEADKTALLIVDPFNDFLSEGGKAWPRVQEVAEDVGLLNNMRNVVESCRNKGFKIVFVPHHHYEPGDLAAWSHPTPYQQISANLLLFEKNSWGGEYHQDFQPRPDEVIVNEHWGSSGFANTDLDLQLRQHGISKIILIGMIANTCIEATGRFGMELGYHVTLIKDSTAAFSHEAMHAAHEINGPTYAHAVFSTGQFLQEIEK